jgi:LAS superfamily LD-carboxypeptidase LdcB
LYVTGISEPLWHVRYQAKAFPVLSTWEINDAFDTQANVELLIFFFFFNQLSKLEKQQQRKEKTRAKGPSESSKERNAPRKEDRSASSGAEGDVSSEREP